MLASGGSVSPWQPGVSCRHRARRRPASDSASRRRRVRLRPAEPFAIGPFGERLTARECLERLRGARHRQLGQRDPQSHRVVARRGSVHAASANSARRDNSFISCDQRVVRAIGVMATTRSMRRVADRPLQRLHAAHRRADDGMQPRDAELLQQAPLRLDHVAQRDARKRIARLAALFDGEVERPLPSASTTTMQGGRCRAPAGSDQEVEPVMRAADRRAGEDPAIVAGGDERRRG